MLSEYRGGGSSVYGSSFVTACDIVLLGKRKVKEILEGCAPSQEKNEGRESYAELKVGTMAHSCH